MSIDGIRMGLACASSGSDEEATDQQERESLRTQNAVLVQAHQWVRNNLQLMTTLVELLSMGATWPAECRQELSHLSTHIRGITVIHDLLTEENESSNKSLSLSVEAVLSRLMPLVQQKNTGHPIYLQVQDTRLMAHQCTSLAIIANELVSNAIKYSSHNVVVSFTVDEHTACLLVQDNGRGFPEDFDPIRDGGTGLNLVMSLSEYDLRGEIVFDNHERGGARIRLSFPIKPL